jgi:hypothetical protein
METEELKTALNRLRADLADVNTVDPELKNMLQMLDRDINYKLSQQSVVNPDQATPALLQPPPVDPAPVALGTDGLPVAPVVASEEEILADRTQKISAKFAVEHPRLEPVLRELGAILQRIGI